MDFHRLFGFCFWFCAASCGKVRFSFQFVVRRRSSGEGECVYMLFYVVIITTAITITIITTTTIGGWGGESKPGNLIGSCVRDPVAGNLELD